MIWTKIQDNTRLIGIIVGAFAFGAMAQSALDKSTKLPWLHQQAAILHQEQVTVIPKLKDAAGCEHWRANVATSVANDPNGDPSKIPADNCPHPTVHK